MTVKVFGMEVKTHEYIGFTYDEICQQYKFIDDFLNGILW